MYKGKLRINVNVFSPVHKISNWVDADFNPKWINWRHKPDNIKQHKPNT